MKIYKINVLLMLLSLFYINVQAQNGINVNVKHIIDWGNGNIRNGSIKVSFNPDVYPVCVDWVGPCADPPEKYLTSGSCAISAIDFSNNEPCPGIYCFSVISHCGEEEECFADFCVEVKYCQKEEVVDNSPNERTPYATITCYSGFDENREIFYGDEDAIYLFGNTTLLQGGKKLDLQYTVLTGLGFETYNKLSDKLNEMTALVSEDILIDGYSRYQIDEQKDIETDEPFVFKYNKEGEIVWVYHNKERDLGLQISDSVELLDEKKQELPLFLEEETTTESFAITKVFPNPFPNMVNLVVNSSATQEIKLYLVNTLGEQIYYEEKSIETGRNELSIHFDKKIPDGFYVLYIEDKHGREAVERLMHFEK